MSIENDTTDFELTHEGKNEIETEFKYQPENQTIYPVEWHEQKHFLGATLRSPLIKVESKLCTMLVLSFTHLNQRENYSVQLMEGSRTLWEVQYMKDGELKGLLGRVYKIIRYEQTEFTYAQKPGYKITFDVSHAFSSKRVTVDAENIRLIKLSKYDDSEYPIHPEEKPGMPIIVPPDAFNYIKRTYPDRYMSLMRIPNPLIMKHVVNGLSMFEGCIAVEEYDPMDTINLKVMDTMFVGNIKLRFLPKMMTYNVISMNGTFSGCESAEFMYALDTHNVTVMDNMFRGCKKLRAIPMMCMILVNSAKHIFKDCTNLEEVSFAPGSVRIPLDFSDCKLTKECVLNVITNLGTPRDELKNTIKFANPPESLQPQDYKYRFSDEEWNNIVKPAIEQKHWGFVGIVNYNDPED